MAAATPGAFAQDTAAPAPARRALLPPPASPSSCPQLPTAQDEVAALAARARFGLESYALAFGPTSTVLTEEHLLRLYGVPLRHVSFEHAGAGIHPGSRPCNC